MLLRSIRLVGQLLQTWAGLRLLGTLTLQIRILYLVGAVTAVGDGGKISLVALMES